MSSNHRENLCYKRMQEATDATFLQEGHTRDWYFQLWQHTRERERDNEGIKRGISWINTSRKEVVSRIKNMLIIPRYLMIRVPGRKDRGVIFTTVTVLPPNEQLERSERERPSGSGLQRSMDETAGTKKKKKRRKRECRQWKYFLKYWGGTKCARIHIWKEAVLKGYSIEAKIIIIIILIPIEKHKY